MDDQRMDGRTDDGEYSGNREASLMVYINLVPCCEVSDGGGNDSSLDSLLCFGFGVLVSFPVRETTLSFTTPLSVSASNKGGPPRDGLLQWGTRV